MKFTGVNECLGMHLVLVCMSSGLEVSQQLLYHGILLLTAHQTANMQIGNVIKTSLICVLLIIL